MNFLNLDGAIINLILIILIWVGITTLIIGGIITSICNLNEAIHRFDIFLQNPTTKIKSILAFFCVILSIIPFIGHVFVIIICELTDWYR